MHATDKKRLSPFPHFRCAGAKAASHFLPQMQALCLKNEEAEVPSYRVGSEWNDENEIRCLIIFKKLEAEKFPPRKQMAYCREMAKITNLGAGNISAKVSNYKSVAGINKTSNASQNTKYIYAKYKDTSVQELESLLK